MYASFDPRLLYTVHIVSASRTPPLVKVQSSKDIKDVVQVKFSKSTNVVQVKFSKDTKDVKEVKFSKDIKDVVQVKFSKSTKDIVQVKFSKSTKDIVKNGKRGSRRRNLCIISDRRLL